MTAKYQLAKELAASKRPVRLLHIGDYDPSGVHMYSALIEDALAFLERLNPEAVVTPERVAVLPKHVKRFKLTTAPAKEGDDRSFVGIGDDPTATVQAEAETVRASNARQGRAEEQTGPGRCRRSSGARGGRARAAHALEVGRAPVNAR